MVKLCVFIVIVHFMLGLCKDIKMSKSLYRCRQICYTKFMEDWQHCMDNEKCKDMCITPPNINNYIPSEAFSFLCWNKCDEQLEPFKLSITSGIKEGSLLLTTIAWDQTITNSSKQCLVTWEVSGGGLMGNLLTDTSTVELSLWMDTVYHVQVTCKNKETGAMRRSNKLIVDTRKLYSEFLSSTSSSSSTSPSTTSTPSSTLSSSVQVPTISSDPSIKNVKKIEDIFLRKSYSKETRNHLQILKDSSSISKDRKINKIESIATKTQTKLPSSSSSSSSSPAPTSSILSSTTTTTTNTEKSSSSHVPSVIRNKLVGTNDDTSSISSSFINNNIIYAIIESVIVFLGILFIYILIRSSRDGDYSSQTLIDKEQLIRNEFINGRRIVHM